MLLRKAVEVKDLLDTTFLEKKTVNNALNTKFIFPNFYFINLNISIKINLFLSKKKLNYIKNYNLMYFYSYISDYIVKLVPYFYLFI